MRRPLLPLEALGAGLLAGAAGTVAMTAAQEAAGWIRSGQSSTLAGLRQPRTWAEAPAPAEIGRRVLQGVFDRRVTKKQVPLLTNALHWAYGIGLGGAYGLAQGTFRLHPLAHGALFGTAAWGLQYALLPAMKLYQAPWKYPPGALAVDLSYHLAYGLGTSASFAALTGD